MCVFEPCTNIVSISKMVCSNKLNFSIIKHGYSRNVQKEDVKESVFHFAPKACSDVLLSLFLSGESHLFSLCQSHARLTLFSIISTRFPFFLRKHHYLLIILTFCSNFQTYFVYYSPDTINVICWKPF